MQFKLFLGWGEVFSKLKKERVEFFGYYHTMGGSRGGGPQGHAPPPHQSAKILKQIGPHFGNHTAPSQYAALPNRKSWNRPCITKILLFPFKCKIFKVICSKIGRARAFSTIPLDYSEILDF